jgi:hypothetical protein
MYIQCTAEKEIFGSSWKQTLKKIVARYQVRQISMAYIGK